jgi:hypothetical protein
MRVEGVGRREEREEGREERGERREDGMWLGRDVGGL